MDISMGSFVTLVVILTLPPFFSAINLQGHSWNWDIESHWSVPVSIMSHLNILFMQFYVILSRSETHPTPHPRPGSSEQRPTAYHRPLPLHRRAASSPPPHPSHLRPLLCHCAPPYDSCASEGSKGDSGTTAHHPTNQGHLRPQQACPLGSTRHGAQWRPPVHRVMVQVNTFLTADTMKSLYPLSYHRGLSLTYFHPFLTTDTMKSLHPLSYHRGLKKPNYMNHCSCIIILITMKARFTSHSLYRESMGATCPSLVIVWLWRCRRNPVLKKWWHSSGHQTHGSVPLISTVGSCSDSGCPSV